MAPASGLAVPSVADSPTDDALREAIALLRDELFGEFAFADEASRANAMGLLLSLCLRPAIGALLPLALIDAPIAGSGKSILASAIGMVATGRPAHFTTPPDGNDEELRKRLTSLLLGGARFVVFDNAGGPVQSPVLAQMLTADIWSDRVLGVSKMASLPQRVVWTLTGNNIQLGGDLLRRCYVIRLDPQMAYPWRRQFKKPDLLRWAAEQRSDLLHAVLVIGRAWFAAGCPAPAQEPKPWGSYHEFQRVVGGMLSHAGVEGFLTNLDTVQTESDTEGALWCSLLRMWAEHLGSRPVRTRELLKALDVHGRELELPGPLANSLAQAHDDHARATRLSTRLDRISKRRFEADGIRIEASGFDGLTKTKLWRIVADAPVTPAP